MKESKRVNVSLKLYLSNNQYRRLIPVQQNWLPEQTISRCLYFVRRPETHRKSKRALREKKVHLCNYFLLSLPLPFFFVCYYFFYFLSLFLFVMISLSPTFLALSHLFFFIFSNSFSSTILSFFLDVSFVLFLPYTMTDNAIDFLLLSFCFYLFLLLFSCINLVVSVYQNTLSNFIMQFHVFT